MDLQKGKCQSKFFIKKSFKFEHSKHAGLTFIALPCAKQQQPANQLSDIVRGRGIDIDFFFLKIRGHLHNYRKMLHF